METKTTDTQDPAENKLVNVDELLEILWTKQSRPSSRWLRDRTDSGEVPSTRLGGRIFYSVDAVREALLRKPKLKAHDMADEPEVIHEAFQHNSNEVKRRRIAETMRVES